jgi:hypothetical protein
VTQDGNALQFVWKNSGLRDDRDVVAAAVLKTPYAAVFAGDTFFNNPRLWLPLVEDNENVLQGVLVIRRRREIEFSDDLILEVVKLNGNVMKLVPTYLSEAANFRWAAATADRHPQFDLMKLILREIMNNMVANMLPEKYKEQYKERVEAGEEKSVLPEGYRPSEYISKALHAKSDDERARYEAKDASWLRPYQGNACEWVERTFNKLLTIVKVLDRELSVFEGEEVLMEQLKAMRDLAAHDIIPYLLDPIRNPCDGLNYESFAAGKWGDIAGGADMDKPDDPMEVSASLNAIFPRGASR